MRVGVTGYAHEVNAFADPIGSDHGIDAARAPGGLAAGWEAGPLVQRLLAAGSEVVELPVWEFGASGPLQQAAFDEVLSGVLAAIDATTADGRLDAVVVLGHGAGRTSGDADPDATFLTAVRARVGESVPIVVVLDFHANLTPAMCAAVDAVIGYRTNPHVDIAERLLEAADTVLLALVGWRWSVVHVTLPMVLPQIAQLTTPGEPLGEVTDLAQAAAVPPVRNVSVFGGFSLTDAPGAGLSVCVTVDAGSEPAGIELCRRVAHEAWARRHRYRLHAVPLAAAVDEAVRAAGGGRPPVLLADVADNPGGGAPANSPFVLRALLEAGVSHACLGLQCDPAVVEQAWQRGVGAVTEFEFNAGSTRPLAPPLRVTAEVTALVDSPLVPTRGVYAGSTRHPGRCCALRIGGADGIEVGVSSWPVQCADDDTLVHAGLSPSTARVVVVKSRGHFRAGFDHLFPDDRIVEVGAPGVATPELDTLPWQHLDRPVFPLDPLDDTALDAVEPVVHPARTVVRA